MAITAQQIIDDARLAVVDPDAAGWSDEFFLMAMNAVISEISEARPDATTVTGDVSLVAGTRQSLPMTAAALVDIPRNTGGRAIRKTNAALLDAQRPGWHTDTSGATRNYAYDPRTPRIFYVWPPAIDGAEVEMKYRAAPTVLTDPADSLPIDDTFRQLVLDGVLWRAYALDAEHASSAALASLFKSAYEAGLGRKTAADAAALPQVPEEA